MQLTSYAVALTLATSNINIMLTRSSKTTLNDLSERAAELALVLKELANEKRLLILCALLKSGECTVATLAETVDLSQSALSQHLARLRDQSMVEFRREGTTLFYSVSDRKIALVLKNLKSLYC